MKYKIIYIALLMMSLSSCSEFLEVVPDNASTIEEQLQTPEDAREFLNGAYDAMTSTSTFGGHFALVSELMSDGVENIDLNGDWAAHYNRTTGIFNTSTRNIMRMAYQAVGRANNLLDHIDLVDGLSETDKTIIEGEVKFIRAINHFEAVRFFGQPYGFTGDNNQLGVPIQVSQSLDLINRSSVGDVYNQVISDLNDAVQFLPPDNGIYANSWSAKAFLARVYFQMNNFDEAFNMANDVIENSPYSFDSDYSFKYGFGESNEVVFGLQSSNVNFDNANGGYRDMFRLNNGIPAFYVSNEYANIYLLESEDTRSANWLTNDNNKQICNKFNINEAYTNPVIHITELKLIRGESAAETGNPAIGVVDLNDIRERAGLVSLSSSLAGEPLIQQLRIERRKELLFENNRMHELKRQAVLNQPNLEIRGAIWNCPGMVCQLPDEELKGNPEMQANPQGGCN